MSEPIPDLSGHLTPAEKKVRDIELAEQAKKFFGGLNDDERRRLGMEAERSQPSAAAVLEAEGIESEDGEAVAEDKPRASTGVADGVAAALSLLAFIGILIWVIGSR